MVDFIFERNGWHTPDDAVNYLLYGYERDPGSKLGTAFTMHFLTKYAPAAELACALRRTGSGSHEFDLFGCIDRLRRFEKSGRPLRIIGFPSFLYRTLSVMGDLDVPPMSFPGGSLVFTSGGWKGYAGKRIDSADLRELIAKRLGIPADRVRDACGSVEHSVPCIQCDHHRLHVPVWSQVYIRDVKTLEPLDHGKPGFLHFVSPCITSVPASSVLMGDLAALHPSDSCPCGTGTEWFEILGRAGTSKNRSCAVAASELPGRGNRG